MSPVWRCPVFIAAALLAGCASGPALRNLGVVVKDAHEELTAEIPNGTKFAVWDITHEENRAAGAEITELLREMTLALRRTRGFRLIETEEYALKALMKELNLSTSGLVSDADAVRIGQWLGVDMMILGRVENRVLRVWVVHVESRERIVSVRRPI
ncbi:MAG: CsgG/HfaB family protein [Treponema sp.]|nr:CsgG/HfaB family protein [Treponema sp.]